MKIDKKDYPKMPDDIRDMIKQQVENEITNNVSEIRPVTKRRFVRYVEIRKQRSFRQQVTSGMRNTR